MSNLVTAPDIENLAEQTTDFDKTTYATQVSRLSPVDEAYKQAIMDAAITQGNVPYQGYGYTDPETGTFVPGQRVAGFTDPQTQAFSRINQLVGGVPLRDAEGNLTGGHSGTSYQRPTGQYDEFGQPIYETVTGASAWEPWMQQAADQAMGATGYWEQYAPQAFGLYGEGAQIMRGKPVYDKETGNIISYSGGATPEAMTQAREGLGAFTATLPEALNAYESATGEWSDVAGDIGARARGLGTLLDPYAARSQADVLQARRQAAGTYGEFSQYQPIIEESYKSLGTEFDPYSQQAKTYLEGATGKFEREGFYPSRGIAAYMSPYTESVKEAAFADIDEAQAQGLNQLRADAAAQGAFGGARHGLAEGQAISEALKQKSRIGAELDQANYAQALQAAMGEHAAQEGSAQQAYESQRAGEQAAASGISQLGQVGTGISAQEAAGLSGLAQLGMGARQGIAGMYGNLAGQEQAAGMNLAGLGAQEAQLLSGLGTTGAQVAERYGQNLANLGQTESQIRSNLAQQLYGIGSGTAGLYGQLGQGIGALGEAGAGIGQQASAQFAGLGGLTSQYGMQDINALMTAGGMQQNLGQALLGADYDRFMEEKMDPYQQIGFVSDIFKGVPTSQASMTSGFTPQGNTVANVLGAGVTGLGLFGGSGSGGGSRGGGSSSPSWS